MVQQEDISQQGRQDVGDGRDDSSCDESKCVSLGLSWNFNESFTCYTDDDLFPMMCADGYQPRVVDSVSPVLETVDPIWLIGWWFDSHSPNSETGNPFLFRYYTCCPPDLPFEIEGSRHCSDPVAESKIGRAHV